MRSRVLVVAVSCLFLAAIGLLWPDPPPPQEVWVLTKDVGGSLTVALEPGGESLPGFNRAVPWMSGS